MSYCSGGKMWCRPSDLTNAELEHFIDLLWANFAFDNGEDIVHDMLVACERELKDRRMFRASRNLCNWSHLGWPKKGTPVIEYTFATDEATAILFDWSTVDIINREQRTHIQRDEEGLQGPVVQRNRGRRSVSQ